MCIRFIEDNVDYALVCEDCWDHKDDCRGVDISGFREKVIDFIFTAYID